MCLRTVEPVDVGRWSCQWPVKGMRGRGEEDYKIELFMCV